jgi:hypothetical protein
MATNGWTYRSAKSLVIVLTVLFGMGLLVDLVLGAITLVECSALQNNLNGAGNGLGNPEDPDIALGLVQLGAGVLWGLLYLVTAVIFCVWIYRVNANARALGAADMTITPGWSVGWFFIPFANLVKPYVAVKEIWNASDSHPDEVSALGGVPLLVGTWWGAWLLSNVLGNASFRATFAATKPEEVLRANYISLADDVVTVGLFILVILLVQGIHKRQTKLFRAVRKLRRQQAAAAETERVQPAW